MPLILSNREPKIGDIYFWKCDIEKDKKHNREPHTHFRIILSITKDKDGKDSFIVYRNVKTPERIIDIISIAGLKNSIRDGYIVLYKIDK